MHKKISTYLMFGVGALAVVGIAFVSIQSAQKLFTSAATKYNPQEPPKVTATDTKATISWKSRNKTISLVNYGSSPETLTLPAFDREESNDHNVGITNLVPNTTYYYRIATSGEIYPETAKDPLSFTTAPSQHAKVIPPVCLVTVFESMYESKPGDGKYNASYDLYPPEGPDGAITPQDYFQCLLLNISPTP